MPDSLPVPAHIAIIMDGNGRWAQNRGLPRVEGHRQGVEAVKGIVRDCANMGVKYLTLYGFSTENWKRPKSEISGLMQLFRRYIRQNLKDLNERNVRIRVIGEREGLEEDILGWADKSVEETKNNTGMQLILAFNYGGQQEITRAANKALKALGAGDLNPADLTPTSFDQFLDTGDIPRPELLIRTSGEKRISNFLLWQAVDAHLYFTETLWPDFDKKGLVAAIEDLAAAQNLCHPVT
ncbi:MAG: di-trans,poly-cis-decaprenylcistransferase [Alphaproteobacteria bacterium]|nr:MAG: di-trans,poly-cis-decaprenylcistransferase [Alphaproteobacteria bacterium]